MPINLLLGIMLLEPTQHLNPGHGNNFIALGRMTIPGNLHT